jgi:hypothetical protein
LLDRLPVQCHLLINSRTLPRLPWVALVAKHEAVVLKDSRLLTSGFYSESVSENPNVEVFALGERANRQHLGRASTSSPLLLCA